jgi:cytochrome c-type biogenesis protein CcmH/NrfG
LTTEQAQRKSRELWIQALDAEERGDYAKAKGLYEQMMTTLPREAWYQGVEARLRLVKNELGEK